MNKFRRTVCENFRDRPFDFYVAFVLFLAGIYAIVSDTWPESIADNTIQMIIVVISLYYILAGVVIMFSLGCRRRKYPVLALMGEMYGWMAVSAASIATVILYVWFAFIYVPSSWWIWIIMVMLWVGMATAAGLRFLDLYLIYKGLRK